MNTKRITVTSRGERALVTIHTSKKQITRRWFSTLDAAKDFVLPRGNHNTVCLLNGIKVVFAGWTGRYPRR